METWLVPKKAAMYLKEKNPNTMINERILRALSKSSFPCLRIDSMTLINVDTFDADLEEFVRANTEYNKSNGSSKIKKIIT